MTVLTLLVKAYSSSQLTKIDDLLRVEFENLDLDFNVLGAPVNKWVQVSLSGEDEVIATNYVNKEIGTCPVSIKRVEKFSVLKGYITKVDTVEDELTVDVGVFEPRIIQATIPLASLQTQLAGGKKFSLKQIAELFGFQVDLPLSVKVVDFDGRESGLLRAELSAAQLERIGLWRDSLLDRLIVLRATIGDIKSVLERTRLNRDVIEVERLGLFAHALTCKLGTDAAGLVPKLGRYMRSARFVVFNSKRLVGIIGEEALSP